MFLNNITIGEPPQIDWSRVVKFHTFHAFTDILEIQSSESRTKFLAALGGIAKQVEKLYPDGKYPPYVLHIQLVSNYGAGLHITYNLYEYRDDMSQLRLCMGKSKIPDFQ